ncbi:MAG: hypothetical protein H0T89_09140 [Deltaproteobacteria bacterium]|nr:hypothetical protein [Deltaproteobacteria bacterium]MDQ3295982.1 hypothetical protein [Myxococcota bacterium]
MIEHSALPLTDTTSDEAPRHVNSSDATVGKPIAARVMARKQELEGLLAGLAENDVRARSDIELALSTVEELLTGDLTNIPAVVASDLNRWLEHNKHLAESALAAAPTKDGATAPTISPEEREKLRTQVEPGIPGNMVPLGNTDDEPAKDAPRKDAPSDDDSSAS